MAKAYDSISIAGLEKALQRIDIPEPIIKFLILLFKNREMRVITEWSLTEAFIARDGIDQGDTISPLPENMQNKNTLILYYFKDQNR